MTTSIFSNFIWQYLLCGFIGPWYMYMYLRVLSGDES
jgi:hypothetical protein